MKEIIKIGRDLVENGEDFVIAKVIQTEGSTPRKKGAWLLMTRDGKSYGTVGGGKLEAAVLQICRETFETRDSRIHEFNLSKEDQKGIDMRCGGDASVSIEYVDHLDPSNFEEDAPPAAVAYIFGAGHVGKEIGKTLKYIGFETVILDDRQEFANWDRFPDADRIILIEDYKTAYDSITTDQNSYIVIVTRGHSGDLDVLRQALKRENAYIGMIGSRKKIGTIFENLLNEGCAKAELERVHSPIGLDIGAETPEEIAISVAAEMIRVRAELQ